MSKQWGACEYPQLQSNYNVSFDFCDLWDNSIVILISTINSSTPVALHLICVKMAAIGFCKCFVVWFPNSLGFGFRRMMCQWMFVRWWINAYRSLLSLTFEVVANFYKILYQFSAILNNIRRVLVVVFIAISLVQSNAETVPANLHDIRNPFSD